MKQDEITKLAEELLKSVSGIREHIRLIDIDIKKNSYDMNTIEELKQERLRVHKKLSRILKSVSNLEEQNQRIICYRYFEKLTYSEIARRVGLTHNTIPRRINKCLLNIGRVIFGFEDEFWKSIDFE